MENNAAVTNNPNLKATKSLFVSLVARDDMSAFHLCWNLMSERVQVASVLLDSSIRPVSLMIQSLF